MTMAMRQCGINCIDLCIMLSASIWATGRRTRSSIFSVSPWRLPAYKLLIANKCISLAGDFDDHGNAPVQYQSHWPMHCAQSFNLSHWTPQLVEYLLCISPATASIQAIYSKQMHLTCWRFWWPWRCASMVPSSLTHASFSVLQLNPLDTAIGQVFTPYRPCDCQHTSYW